MAGDTQQTAQSVLDKIEDNWIWFLALGIALLIGGMILIAAPHASSVAVTLLIAAVLVVGGALQIYQAFKSKDGNRYLWSLITGIIAVIGGIVIYANPLAGTFALTLVIAAVFIAQGISQLLFAYRLRPNQGWGWIGFAGLMSLLAGLMIWLELPSSAAWALGLVAGISVIFNGWSYIAVALAAKSMKSN
ncbi:MULTISPECIES: HdeD family acid-resistance protein [Roseibium]|uniref:HdeD family acid-resistance protein n=1 Tax=Roseibium polysiphoniae TaxID=2571221 RepID=A0ABR9C9C2_9HYPH|nr:HdeD family acid-resistance protein [Roseibium polysiphoniae]MBD8876490.1 HdeD family acid-resistance protein [Roseibium polysiphoniae]